MLLTSGCVCAIVSFLPSLAQPSPQGGTCPGSHVCHLSGRVESFQETMEPRVAWELPQVTQGRARPVLGSAHPRQLRQLGP